MEMHDLALLATVPAAAFYLFRVGANHFMKRFIEDRVDIDIAAAFTPPNHETIYLGTACNIIKEAREIHSNNAFLASRYNIFISRKLRDEYGWKRHLFFEAADEFEETAKTLQ
jgi:hypothetical protein